MSDGRWEAPSDSVLGWTSSEGLSAAVPVRPLIVAASIAGLGLRDDELAGAGSALVSAVRDAERLTEARRLAAEVREYGGWDMTVPPDRPEGAPVIFTIETLLDLLTEPT